MVAEALPPTLLCTCPAGSKAEAQLGLSAIVAPYVAGCPLPVWVVPVIIGAGTALLALVAYCVGRKHRLIGTREIRLLNEVKLREVELRALSAAEKAMDSMDRAAAKLGVAREELARLSDEISEMRKKSSTPETDRFTMRTMVFGRQSDAALGIEPFLCVPERTLLQGRLQGVESIRAEFEALGDATAIACMRYVLDCEAGSSMALFPNSPYPMDHGPSGLLECRQNAVGRGMHLEDFCLHPAAKIAKLDPMQVAALRIYTTAAFSHINDALRDLQRQERGEPHPLPLTTALIRDAVVRLRAVGAQKEEEANACVDLWRGLKNSKMLPSFSKEGGTELAPMSTTSDLGVALRYALGDNGALLRLLTRSSMERGAQISWLSAFPGEAEYLYPPLTYLQPTEEQELELAGLRFHLVTVEPRL